MDLRNLLVVFATMATFVECENDVASGKIIFPKLPVAPLNSTNRVCMKDSEIYLEHLGNLTLWAHKMWDATAKSTTGTLQGNVFQMGDWDECMKANGPFRSQFCFATITGNVNSVHAPEDPLSLRFDPMDSILRRIYRTHDISQQGRNTVRMGWCVPASCSSETLEEFLNEYLSRDINSVLNENNVSFVAEVPELMCQKENEAKPLQPADIIFCVLVAVFVLLVIISTIYDFNRSYAMTEKEKIHLNSILSHRLIIAFSARKNFHDLSRADDSNPPLSILYGLKTVAIFIIIMGHRFGTFVSGPVINFDDIEEQYRSVGAWFIFHGDLFVDTFFIISGILVTYGLMVQYDKKYINPGFFIFLRYMRLTPVYAFVVFYYATVLNYIGSGPLWKLIIDGESSDCRSNWWTNLLYVNNYVNDDHICLTQSWYLSCDLHYFIIAMFLIVLTRKNKKLGFSLFTVLFVLSMAIPFIITVVHLRPALLNFYPDFVVAPKVHPDFRLTYIKSHTRASPYFVGMLCGYVYYKMKDDGKEMSKLKSHTLTLVSIVLLIVSVASAAVFYDPYHKYNVLESATYAALNRPTWAFGTIGLLLSASYGHTTLVQRVLSWSPFVPLSKLVYGAYLMHMSFQFRALAMTVSPQYFNYFSLFSLVIGDIMMSFIAGFFLYMVIEAPIRKLFRELLLPPRKPHTNNAVSAAEAATREAVAPNNTDSGSSRL